MTVRVLRAVHSLLLALLVAGGVTDLHAHGVLEPAGFLQQRTSIDGGASHHPRQLDADVPGGRRTLATRDQGQRRPAPALAAAARRLAAPPPGAVAVHATPPPPPRSAAGLPGSSRAPPAFLSA